MGMFSRFVLGFPPLLQTSIPTFHGISQSHQLPDSGSRPTLRFMSVVRSTQKRRRVLKDGSTHEEEITLLQAESNHFHFAFVGEVIEDGSESFMSHPKPLSK